MQKLFVDEIRTSASKLDSWKHYFWYETIESRVRLSLSQLTQLHIAYTMRFTLQNSDSRQLLHIIHCIVRLKFFQIFFSNFFFSQKDFFLPVNNFLLLVWMSLNHAEHTNGVRIHMICLVNGERLSWWFLLYMQNRFANAHESMTSSFVSHLTPWDFCS